MGLENALAQARTDLAQKTQTTLASAARQGLQQETAALAQLYSSPRIGLIKTTLDDKTILVTPQTYTDHPSPFDEALREQLNRHNLVRTNFGGYTAYEINNGASMPVPTEFQITEGAIHLNVHIEDVVLAPEDLVEKPRRGRKSGNSSGPNIEGRAKAKTPYQAIGKKGEQFTIAVDEGNRHSSVRYKLLYPRAAGRVYFPGIAVEFSIGWTRPDGENQTIKTWMASEQDSNWKVGEKKGRYMRGFGPFYDAWGDHIKTNPDLVFEIVKPGEEYRIIQPAAQ